MDRLEYSNQTHTERSDVALMDVVITPRKAMPPAISPKAALNRFVNGLIINYAEEHRDGGISLKVRDLPEADQLEFVAEIMRVEPNLECLTETYDYTDLSLSLASALEGDKAECFFREVKRRALRYYKPRMQELIEMHLGEVEENCNERYF